MCTVLQCASRQQLSSNTTAFAFENSQQLFLDAPVTWQPPRPPGTES